MDPRSETYTFPGTGFTVIQAFTEMIGFNRLFGIADFTLVTFKRVLHVFLSFQVKDIILFFRFFTPRWQVRHRAQPQKNDTLPTIRYSGKGCICRFRC